MREKERVGDLVSTSLVIDVTLMSGFSFLLLQYRGKESVRVPSAEANATAKAYIYLNIHTHRCVC